MWTSLAGGDAVVVHQRLDLRALGSGPGRDDKVVKNRVSSAYRPRGTTGRIGQRGDETWTVLADPEGNEFCVVRPKQPLTS